MFHLLLLIISYGALLPLLMPPTNEGIVLIAAVFAIGICLFVCLFVYKKTHRVAFWKNKHYFLIPLAILIAASLGISFYYRWFPSSKMRMIATMLHMPIETMLRIGSSMLSGASAYFLYVALQVIVKILFRTKLQNDFLKSLESCLFASIVTVVLVQIMVYADILSMGYINFMWGVLIVSVAILFVYCLLGRIMPSISFGAGFFMVISTINAYVYKFRDRLFEPVDIFSLGAAMNVAANYSLFPVPLGILTGWSVFIAMLVGFYHLRHKSESKLAIKNRCLLLAICAISSVAISFYASDLYTFHWLRSGANYYGYILDFVSKFKEISVQEPDNYSTDLIDKLTDQYAPEGHNRPETELSEYPHIIVIMDEAFSDLSVLGEFSTNMEVTPFISSLKENTVSGYALASVCGGNTANSEYEFLTGNSMAWMSPNTVPYQQYIRSSTYSMVSYLKSSYNYQCVAMHPFQSSGWNRPAAYKHLGFDECYFVEDFPQKNYVRQFVSDQEMFEFMIKTFETNKDNPLFLFGVTMQNHGDYDYTGDNYTQHISLNNFGNAYPDVEQYLSLIYETDRAVEYLISYFQNINEDVVIVFFGDHQPGINNAFHEAVSRTAVDTFDKQQKRYEVPFFIWANYDIEEKHIDCTSLNYLSSYVYDAAGIALPPYNQFLQDIEKAIPFINANGYYSISAECFLPFNAANVDEQRWLELYEVLQYNSIFDSTHRSKTFFPVLE